VRYQQDLQVKLGQRLRALMTAGFSTPTHEVRMVVEWIERQPALRAILTDASRVEPDLPFDSFYNALAAWRGPTPLAQHNRSRSRHAGLGPDETPPPRRYL
jgi:hypothetical protein